MRKQVIDIMVELGCATYEGGVPYEEGVYRYTYIVEKDGRRYAYHKKCSHSVYIEEGWEDTDKPHKGKCLGITRCVSQYELDTEPHIIDDEKLWCYKSVLISICANDCRTKGKVQMYVDKSRFLTNGFIYVTAYIYLV